MAQKQIQVDQIGSVTFQKRKGARNIRLSVGHDGLVKVTMPPWSPYHIGISFVQSKKSWIALQQAGKTQPVLSAGKRIGKAHRIRFMYQDYQVPTSRITNTEIIVRLPLGRLSTENDIQAIVRAAAIRALKQEAKNLLPQRLHALALQHNFTYQTVAIKRLKSRWGSCSSQKDIALNCFLMQLPWELIDYVILHELLHTRIMAHGEIFWNELSQYVSSLPLKRKAMRQHQPSVLMQD